MEPKWLKVKLAAKYAGVSERTIRAWLRRGLRHSRLPSNSILIKTDWIDQFLEAFAVDERAADEIVRDIVERMK